MISFDKPLPAYLNDKKNIIRLIIFTSVFALVFLNIYSPFGADRWLDLTSLEFFAISSLCILTGIFVIILSRIIMYYFSGKHVLVIWKYIIWIFLEVLCMAFFYALFIKYVLEDSRPLSDITEASSRNTALVLLLPYSISWLYFSWQDKKDQLVRMKDGTDHQVLKKT
jgi:hypothetical protein